MSWLDVALLVVNCIVSYEISYEIGKWLGRRAADRMRK